MMEQKCSLIIKNLTPGLTERGKIKIGEKGRKITSKKGTEFQPPKKLDHFRIVSLTRGPDGNYLPDKKALELFGPKPTEIPVRLLYDDISLNFQCHYACFIGRTKWCYGDGEKAYRLQSMNSDGRITVECPCERQTPEYPGSDRCKINACLSVIIDGMDRVGGVWKFRTTSYHSTVGILSSLSLIKRITGGPLAGIPLIMTLYPKTVTDPKSGKLQQVWVVGLEYPGSITELQQVAYKMAEQTAVHYARIEKIEEQAKLLLATTHVADSDIDHDDMIEEFYPEQVTVRDSGNKQTPSGLSNEAEIVNAESTDGNNDYADGGKDDVNTETPTESREQEPPKQEDSKPRRSRRRKFQVDKEVFGTDELITCGATPEQLLELRKLTESDPTVKQDIIDNLERMTGYKQLSYLREDEAQKLIDLFSAPTSDEDDSADEPQEPEIVDDNDIDDLVECPLKEGEKMSKSTFCLTGLCRFREQHGFCSAVDDAPSAEGLI